MMILNSLPSPEPQKPHMPILCVKELYPLTANLVC